MTKFHWVIFLLGWFFTSLRLLAQQPPQALYDESKVPSYTLPDPLVMLNGIRVTNTKTWNEKRRAEILDLFEVNVYGRTVLGKPKEMTWEIVEEHKSMHDSAVSKGVTVYFTGKKDGPKMNLTVTLPAGKNKVPVFLMPTWTHDPKALIRRGYGLVSFNPWDIEPDKNDTTYTISIRKSFASAPKTEIAKAEWGAIGVWAWALSRAMDYIETDKGIDANKVCIMGFSRYGKVVMWAGAQDERFAVVLSNESGCGGVVIVRRGYGETVRSINGYAPHWFNQKFKTYNDHVNDLPLDWHMLISLIAPRPVYIATAEEDRWGDPQGSFLAAKHAEPVYKLFAKNGLGVDERPPLETPVGDYIGYHIRKGKHGLLSYDWEQFINFSDKHLGISGR